MEFLFKKHPRGQLDAWVSTAENESGPTVSLMKVGMVATVY